MLGDHEERARRALRAASKDTLPPAIEPHHSVVLDLGFDSLKIAMLALALEEEFGCPMMLDEWIRLHRSPGALTVASLCDFLREVVPNAESPRHE